MNYTANWANTVTRSIPGALMAFGPGWPALVGLRRRFKK